MLLTKHGASPPVTRGHCYAPGAQTAGVIFDKIKAGIIKDSHSDFLIRTKPRSKLSIWASRAGGGFVSHAIRYLYLVLVIYHTHRTRTRMPCYDSAA